MDRHWHVVTCTRTALIKCLHAPHANVNSLTLATYVTTSEQSMAIQPIFRSDQQTVALPLAATIDLLMIYPMYLTRWATIL